ncbi:MAG TPA: hypothetical protein VIV11_37355 [Kofleriaceae bacterium]
MNVESIQVPAERVPPIAGDVAGSSKVVAGVLFFVTVIIALAMHDVLTNKKFDEDRPRDSAEAAGQSVGKLLGVGLFVGLPALFGFRAARNASRATRAGNVAKTDPKYTFRLSGKYMIAADGAGVPHPELSFKVNGKNRTMLLALPHAEVVNKS